MVVRMTEKNSITLQGRIVAAYGREYEVRIEGRVAGSERLMCSPRGKKSLYACGDEVEVVASNETQGVINVLKTRRSILYRADAFKEKLIAANVTQVVMVAATEPGFSDELLMRCLCAVESQGLEGVIVLNKCDLTTNLQLGRDLLAPFAKLGHPVLELSAQSDDVEVLRRQLAGHVSLLVGQSGMGKTTLTNALIPEALAKTGILSEALNSGKHTTTHTRWYDLPGGGALIDSPGLQAFGLTHLSGEQIEEGFRDMRAMRGQCRFRDCQHDREPGCAFHVAVAAGELDARRFQVFQTLLAEHRRKPKY
jgi:ribosome biogenesis GTPase / thiamine phosphate phosphatase